MAKSKSAQPTKAVKAAKDAEVKAISSVKMGAVTKPSQTPKSKSKEVAKQVAAKTEKRDKKSKPKEPTPEPSSDEDSDDAMTSDESSSGSDSESEDQAPAVKTNGLKKANGAVESTPAAAETSESSESSDSESDAEIGASVPAAEAAAVKLPSNGDDVSEDSSEEEDDSEGSSEDDSEGESEDDIPTKADKHESKVKGAVDAKSLQGKLEKVASEVVSSAESDDEDSDSELGSSSESDSSSDEEEEAEATPAKKRKAEVETTAVSKKPKTEQAEVNGDAAGKGNLFVGNLSWNVDEEWLSREFEKFGELKSVRIIMDRNNPGRSKGFGYVEFVNGADGITAHKEMRGAEIDNRTINVDFAEAKKERAPGGFQDRSQKYGDTPGEPTSTLFVANLAFGSTEDDVTEAFGGYGSIMGVRLPTDRDTGKPKGYGYVQFNSVEDATAAMDAMSGQSINDRPIRLDYASQKPANNDSPRGGGRGRGRGGFDRGFDRGGRGGGRGRGGSDRGGRGGGFRGGRGGSTNRGGFGDFQGRKMTF